MEQYNGKIICSGIASGRLKFYTGKHPVIEHYIVDDTEAEIARYEEANRIAIRQLNALHEKALAEVGEADAMIFDMHIMLLQDMDYHEAVCRSIQEDKVNAEVAVEVTCDRFVKMLLTGEEENLRARAVDIKDISNRLVRILYDEMCTTDPAISKSETVYLENEEPHILVTDDLTPEEFIQLDKSKIAAFVTKQVSFYSHTAILVRNMGIPMLTEADIPKVWNGEIAVVDAKGGKVLVNPDHEILEKYLEEKKEDEDTKMLLTRLKGRPDITKDGREVKLYANIDNITDLDGVLINDAAGIGLFRSEFLYFERDSYPTEDEQFAVYRTVAEKMNGKKVIIRTLDIGADKQADYFKLDKEENPALGYRAIRICLDRVDMFKTQLRAIYRAAAYGNIGILFPMIVSLEEVLAIKKICVEVQEELAENRVTFGAAELGIMIETPAAVMISDILAKEVSFFSIGTNDLIQYTLAADRQNTRVSSVYDVHHPAILRMIQMVVENAHGEGCRVGICGELASNTLWIKQFIRMGIDELSVASNRILPLRKIILESTCTE